MPRKSSNEISTNSLFYTALTFVKVGAKSLGLRVLAMATSEKASIPVMNAKALFIILIKKIKLTNYT